jgi:hypothetical protein
MPVCTVLCTRAAVQCQAIHTLEAVYNLHALTYIYTKLYSNGVYMTMAACMLCLPRLVQAAVPCHYHFW